MSKTSGLGQNLYVAGVDVSNDTGSISRCNGGPATLDMTGIDKSAYERQGGVRDGGLGFVSYFNPTVAHPLYSALPTSDVVCSYFTSTTLGDPVLSLVAKQVNYDGKRGNDGSFVLDVTMESNGFGTNWGLAGTAGKKTDTAATNGTGIDNAASSAFGLQAFLHVFSFTGTSITVKVQDSPDNVTYTDVVGGTFATATGVTSQRIATASGLSVARYLRVISTGTFNPCTFAVSIHRNATATVF